MPELRIARSELILGSHTGGKAQRAEDLAVTWLAQDGAHRAVYIATAQAWDSDMRERIDRRRHDRDQRVRRMEVVEAPQELAHAMGAHSRADTLIVVDCLTLWLTAQMLSMPKEEAVAIANALAACAGPIVLIGNEIGEDAAPTGPDSRNFLDALGAVNREAAVACERVTLMSSGEALMLKGLS